MKDILIVVDLQNDFINGTLAVDGAERILPIIKNLIKSKKVYTIATRDIHPENHISFSDNHKGVKPFEFVGKLQTFPRHCIDGTKGAEFHEMFNEEDFGMILDKGKNPNREAFSFLSEIDVLGKKYIRNLDWLNFSGKTVYVCGLATDYCVKATVIDLLRKCNDIKVVTDCIAGVDVENSNKTLIELERFPEVQLVNSNRITFQ